MAHEETSDANIRPGPLDCGPVILVVDFECDKSFGKNTYTPLLYM